MNNTQPKTITKTFRTEKEAEAFVTAEWAKPWNVCQVSAASITGPQAWNKFRPGYVVEITYK